MRGRHLRKRGLVSRRMLARRKFGKRKIRLVHQVRTLPDPWEVPDKDSQAQQYADLITEDAIVSRRKLMNHVRSEKDLSEGWRQRLEALVAGVDRERVLARMRIDGAHWFVDDMHSLLPDLDDFDEDILQDEDVEEFGLTDEESELGSEASTVVSVTAKTETVTEVDLETVTSVEDDETEITEEQED